VFAESESELVSELEMNCNLEKTMVSTYPAWRCPHHTIVEIYIDDVLVKFVDFVKHLADL